MFLITAFVAVAMFLVTNPRLLLIGFATLPSVVVGCGIGAVAGRIIGTDRVDAIIGAILGAIVGGTIHFLLLPGVE
jgi:hypothetical protein